MNYFTCVCYLIRIFEITFYVTHVVYDDEVIDR